MRYKIKLLKNKIRTELYWKITSLRDKDWMPWFIVTFLDWIRYEILFDPYDNY